MSAVVAVDLFGERLPAPVKGTPPKGYAGNPGRGPAGETCRTCHHIARTHGGKYLKCLLIRAHWTGGPGTDIRAKSPACQFWKAPTAG